MAYASVSDIEARSVRELSDEEQSVCSTLLDDAAVLIDAVASQATNDAKMIVSCRMVLRALGSGDDVVPIGANSGSMSGLGYSQSWSIGSNGAMGELYLSKTERLLLGLGNAIGAYSPVQELVRTWDD